MAAFSYRQAEEIRDALRLHGVRYLFIGKSGAILHGYPDTTQDADLYVEKRRENGVALVAALRSLGFRIPERHADEIVGGKDFVQLKDGPFDIDLVFAPDGIERFADAFDRRVEIEGFPVCSIGRHHREQGVGQPRQGPGVVAQAASVPGLPAATPMTTVDRSWSWMRSGFGALLKQVWVGSGPIRWSPAAWCDVGGVSPGMWCPAGGRRVKPRERGSSAALRPVG